MNLWFWFGAITAVMGFLGLLVTVLFAIGVQELAVKEAEIMQYEEAPPGEPEYMRKFRVAQSRFDARHDPIMILKTGARYFAPMLLAGLTLITLVKIFN